MTYEEIESRCKLLHEEGHMSPYAFVSTIGELRYMFLHFNDSVLNKILDDIESPTVVVVQTPYGEARIYV